MIIKRAAVAACILAGYCGVALAQKPKPKPANVQTVITAEDNFNKLIARKGIKEAFMTVADPEGIVFKPDAIKINEFYSTIDKRMYRPSHWQSLFLVPGSTRRFCWEEAPNAASRPF